MSPRWRPSWRPRPAEQQRRVDGPVPRGGLPQYHLSAASGRPGNLVPMKPEQAQPDSPRNRPEAPGPAVEDHGRVVTARSEAAARYRQAQRAVDRHQAATALHLAVEADPAFELALADLDAITGTSAERPGHRQMNWERHHNEVVRTAASGASTSPVSAATRSPSASSPSCASPRGRTTTSRTSQANSQGATRPHGRAVRDGPDGPHLGDRDRADRAALRFRPPAAGPRLGPVASGTT